MKKESENIQALRHVYTARQHSAFFQYAMAAEEMLRAIEASPEPEYFLERAGYLIHAGAYAEVPTVLSAGETAAGMDMPLRFKEAYAKYYYSTGQFAFCAALAGEYCDMYPLGKQVADKEAFFGMMYFTALSLHELEKSGVNPPRTLGVFLKRVHAYGLQGLSGLYADEYMHMEYIKGASLLKRRRYIGAYVAGGKSARYYRHKMEQQQRENDARTIMSAAKAALIRWGLIVSAVAILVISILWFSSDDNRMATFRFIQTVTERTESVSSNTEPEVTPNPDFPEESYIVLDDGIEGGNVRSSHDLDASVVTVVYAGQKMRILDEYDDDGFIWYSIRLEDGKEGWISSRIIKDFEGS